MGYIYAFTAVFLWSFNYIIAASFAQTLMPFEIALGRWLVASCVLLPLTLSDIIACRRILWHHRWLILGMAFVGMVLCNTLIYYAGRTVAPLNMTLLGLTGPIFIVILSALFLKGRISVIQVFGFVAAIIGVVFLISGGSLPKADSLRPADGDWFMLLNAFFFAVYTILQSRRPKEISQKTLLAITAVVGTLMIFPAVWFENRGLSLSGLTEQDIEVFLYLGIINSVLAYLAWNTALDKIGSIRTGVIYYSLPLFSGIEAYILMGQKVAVSQIWGGLSVVLGIVCVSFSSQIQNFISLKKDG